MNREDGFTLMEVLIAMVIFAVGMLAVATMMITATDSNGNARRLTEANSAAMDKLENLMSLPYTHADLQDVNGDGDGGLNNTGGTADYSEVFGGVYTVNWNVAPLDMDGDGDMDDNGTGQPDAKTLTVIVSSQNRGTPRSVSVINLLAEL